MARKRPSPGRIAVRNRKARYAYAIEDTFEAGIALAGSEVKSLRDGKASINEAYATSRDGELFLLNAHIPEYLQAGRFNHEPRRPRKLLMKRREINRLTGAVQREGMTLVPLAIYFNDRGRAKVELALARGKHHYDKRATVKQRDWKIEKARLLRDRG
ncbi:MAG: SsrA-binding protein SmpB [Rhodospirillales bacterium]|jgi:SsrA-binding protein|nr:SsrA-binding protein SmpB [Rhodospirillales bacterium]